MNRVALSIFGLLTATLLACQSPSGTDPESANTAGSGSPAALPSEGSTPEPRLADADLEAVTRTLANLRVIGREHPEQLQDAITQTGMSVEQMDAALFRIAADAAASALYVQLSGE